MVRVVTAVLTAIASAPATSTSDEVMRHTGFSRAQVKTAVESLHNRGLIHRAGPERYQRTKIGGRIIEALTPITPGPKPKQRGIEGRSPRSRSSRAPDSLRERVWRALRRVKKGTLAELLELALHADEVGLNNAREYLARLEVHGIVQRLAKRVPGMGGKSSRYIQYLLVCDLGPRAPMISRHHMGMIDRNTGRLFSREATHDQR